MVDDQLDTRLVALLSQLNEAGSSGLAMSRADGGLRSLANLQLAQFVVVGTDMRCVITDAGKAKLATFSS